MGARSTYSHARANFAAIWNEVESTREPALLERRGHETMALIPADELSSLEETAYLLRSPLNALRLLTALARSRRGSATPTEIEALAEEFGLHG
jgi:antitoxin YefM